MKFREGTPLYSDRKRSREKAYKSKTPEVLRVIMKWVEELQEIVKDPREYFNSTNEFPNRLKK
jgi:hypothetical protein